MNKFLRISHTLRNRDLLITLALFLVTFCLFSLKWDFSLTTDWDLNLFAGVSTVGAERVMRGEMPYRDFWTIYAPGQFYLLAFIFTIFGKHLMVEVIAASIITSAAACMCYWIGRCLTELKFLAIASSAIFIGAMYYTEYFLRVGSYSTGILIVFIILYLVFLFYREPQLKFLLWAGFATGLLIIFKHDVGLYTIIAVCAGLISHHFLTTEMDKEQRFSLLNKLTALIVSASVIVLPVYLYFWFSAGADMVQNLVVFPMTDFRYARPEAYPNLYPPSFHNLSTFKIFDRLTYYLIFTIPFIFFLIGIFTIGMSIKNRKQYYAAIGISVVTAFLFHYIAAHVQINTHIVTMSVYASWMGIILYELIVQKRAARESLLSRSLIVVFIFFWIAALSIKPAYLLWEGYSTRTHEFNLAKVSGFRGEKYQVNNFKALKTFVNNRIPMDHPVFIGLHRHDVVIIGDVMGYFILDRPIATKFNELHPAIADTARVQQEIIGELKEKKVTILFIKHIFRDDELDRVKINFKKNLPQVGAEDLDNYIKENYVKVKTIGTYEIWELINAN